MNGRQEKIIQTTGLVLVSFLVYTLAGYNYFMEPGIRSLVKHLTPLITYLMYRNTLREDTDGRLRWIMYGFFSVSVGLLIAHYMPRLNQFLPWVDFDSPMGWAVSKLEEAVPITLSIIFLGKYNGDTPVTVFLAGGNMSQSLFYGLAASSLGLVQYVAMMGFVFPFSHLMTSIPWIVVFSVSNSLMEELMFRGLFLRKYGKLFGERYSLVLISAIFAVFHAALLPFMGLTMTVIFILFLFLQAYVWGYITQKTGSIWGAVLAHALADVLFVLAAFSK
jgi:membrane protease YdiL (CAAX protease family)